MTARSSRIRCSASVRRLGVVVLGAIVGASSLACSSQPPYVWASSLPKESAPAQSKASRVVGVGDTIAVAVRAQDSLTGSHVVGLDGFVVLPLVGPVRVAGKEPDAIARELEKALSVTIQEPHASVVLMAKKKTEISVLGEVAHPGKYAVDLRDGVAAAIALAGGLSEFADEDSIYLVREHSPRIRFRMLDLVAGGDSGSSPALSDGDIVVVE